MLPLVLWLALVGFICLVLKEPLHEGEGVTIGIVTVVLFVIPTFVAYWHSRIQVHVYEKGIVREGLSRRSELAWADLLFVRYRAVRQKFHGVDVGVNYYVTLVGRNRQRIKLTNNLRDGVRVINFVLDRILEEQIPRFNVLINQGQEIPFGKISLGGDGLRVKGRLAYWQDISQISLGSGFLRVRLKNKRVAFYKKQFSSIPNGHAFLHLCRQYHSAR